MTPSSRPLGALHTWMIWPARTGVRGGLSGCSSSCSLLDMRPASRSPPTAARPYAANTRLRPR
eukprot:5920442-Lingulodinium_polyedra.AAC.1